MTQPTHRWTSSRWPLVIVLVFVTAAAVAARVEVFRRGWLYGGSAERYANLTLAGLVTLTAFAVVAVRQRSSTPPKPSEGMTIVGGTLAIVTAAVGVVQLVLPNTPYAAAAPACDGVPVQGASFYAQTPAGGVNARYGAGLGYFQADRFAGNCTLGFDGYCVGDPVANDTTELSDTRWLLVHHRDILVSAAKVDAQSPNSALGNEPDSRCPHLGGVTQPGDVRLTARRLSAATVALRTRAPGARLVGYAVRVLHAAGTDYPYSPLKVKQNVPYFTGVWLPLTSVAELHGGTGHVELVASACLAADAPVGEPSVYLATYRRGRLVGLNRSKPESAADARLLAGTACSGPS